MKDNDFRIGFLTVFFSYVMWAFLSIFWGLLSHVNSLYILTQRIIWSMVFMAVYLTVRKKWSSVLSAIKDRKVLRLCFVCGILITINWGVYIYAVTNGHVLDASMGYFLEPIVVAAIGLLLFKEKLSTCEKITFCFAVVGLLWLMISNGTFPWLSLIISVSFSIYGAAKKKLVLSADASLFLETLCMTPFAILAALWMNSHGMGRIGLLPGASYLLLPLCGIVTSVPLLLFNIGVKKIPYYLTGILMYINPSIQFLLGLFYFHEAMDRNRLIAFLFIWIGILFTVYENAKKARASKTAA